MVRSFRSTFCAVESQSFWRQFQYRTIFVFCGVCDVARSLIDVGKPTIGPRQQGLQTKAWSAVRRGSFPSVQSLTDSLNDGTRVAAPFYSGRKCSKFPVANPQPNSDSSGKRDAYHALNLLHQMRGASNECRPMPSSHEGFPTT
jgi:hypothetical protein